MYMSEQKFANKPSYSSSALKISDFNPQNQSGVPFRSDATISPLISLLKGQHFQNAF